MLSSESRKAFDEFMAHTARWERYRLAGKTFRYKVYRALEAAVALCFVLLVLLVAAAPDSWIIQALWVAAVTVAILHYAREAAEKPWLLAAAAFEAFLVWALYNWGISIFLAIPHVAAFCAFLFVLRYWQRGEREVNLAAFFAALAHERSNRAVEPTR